MDRRNKPPIRLKIVLQETMRRFLCGLLCALVPSVAVAAPESGRILLEEDFEGPSDLFTEAASRGGLLEVVAGAGTGKSRGLRAHYEGCEMGSRRMVSRHELPERGSEMTLCYDVKFPEDFQFVRGGKLHGLGPERPITGGKPMTYSGWSARVVFTGEGGVATYLYTQDKESRYGEKVRAKDFRFERGRFHAVSLHVGLNSAPELVDGFAEIYVDGRMVTEQRSVRFRATDDEKSLISKMLFSTFHGGHEPECAPRDAEGKFASVTAVFDNFAVYAGKHVRKAPGRP